MTTNAATTATSCYSGWPAAAGASLPALQLYRLALGVLLTLELGLRFRVLRPFYTDEGTLPLELLMPRVDAVYQWACWHCHLPELGQQQALLALQTLLAARLVWEGGSGLWVGKTTTTTKANSLFSWPDWLTPLASWFLYLSLTLRNTWMNYILDRYFHYLLLHAIFLPTTPSKNSDKTNGPNNTIIISPATISLKLLLFWIYLDAGAGKLLDPLGGWNYYSTGAPLPALDTYARHTTAARYLYAALGPDGLRLLTPTVVWVELGAVPCALWASWNGHKKVAWLAIGLICSLHIGIATCLNNAALLSLVACVPWAVFLPIGWSSTTESANKNNNKAPVGRIHFNLHNIIATICLTAMMLGSIWIDALSSSCDQSVKHIWSTLLHNRWNVFVGAEEYVTWEIAPGQLADGSVVDIWSRTSTVSWSMPGSGAPCTSTARPGRWRSFPYLAELKGADAQALWGYLCDEWNREHPAAHEQLVKYNFFMLQADVLPNMAFSATRKRLIHAHECHAGGESLLMSSNATSTDEPQDEKDSEQTKQDPVESTLGTQQPIPETNKEDSSATINPVGDEL